MCTQNIFSYVFSFVFLNTKKKNPTGLNSDATVDVLVIVVHGQGPAPKIRVLKFLKKKKLRAYLHIIFFKKFGDLRPMFH